MNSAKNYSFFVCAIFSYSVPKTDCSQGQNGCHSQREWAESSRVGQRILGVEIVKKATFFDFSFELSSGISNFALN